MLELKAIVEMKNEGTEETSMEMVKKVLGKEGERNRHGQ